MKRLAAICIMGIVLAVGLSATALAQASAADSSKARVTHHGTNPRYSGDGMILINTDAPWATSREVTLKLNAGVGGISAAQMRFSTNRTTWSAWQAYSKTRAYTLPSGDGPVKVVYVQFQTGSGDKRIDYDTIGLDSVTPTTSDDADDHLHAAPITVHLTATDATSGVASTEYRLDGGAWQTGATVLVPAPADHTGDGTHTIEYRSTDVAGGVEATRNCTVGIDTVNDVIPPVTSDDADDLWHATDVTVHLSASDAGGSGLKETQWRLDEGAWQVGPTALVPAPVDHGGDGIHTLEYYSLDNFGNHEDAKSCQVKIDTTAPVTSDDAPEDWSEYDVTVHLEASDGDSGPATTHYRIDGGAWQTGDSILVPADPDKGNDDIHDIEYYSVDAIGNSETTRSCQVKINVPAVAEAFTIADPVSPPWTEPWGKPAMWGDTIVTTDQRSGDRDIYSFALSSGTVTPICTAAGAQQYPAFVGDAIVWADHRGADWDIYSSDTGGTTETPVCTAAGDQTTPAISGNVIVWADHRGADWDIYAYDLGTHVETPICTAAGDQTAPAISGTTVVWTDHRGADSDIYAYDLGTHTETSICTASGDQTTPAVSGDTVAWSDHRGSDADIYAYDLSDDTETPICAATGDQTEPAVSGTLVTWTDFRDTSRDIHALNLADMEELAVCSDPGDQLNSVAFGSVCVWVEDDGHQWTIFSRDIRTTCHSPETIIAKGSDFYAESDISGNTAVWMVTDQQVKKPETLDIYTAQLTWDVYACDLSTGRVFPICVTAGSHMCPRVSGDIVVWSDNRNGDRNWDIYGYDLDTKRTFPICTAPGNQMFPQIDGDLVVWQDGRNDLENPTPGDIYGCRLPSTIEFPVCTHAGEQRYPVASGNIVVWQDARNGDADIYGRDLTGQTESAICTKAGDQTRPYVSGDTVVWRDGSEGAWVGSIDAYDLQTHIETGLPLGTWGLNENLGRPCASGDIIVCDDAGYWCGIDGYDVTYGAEFPVVVNDYNGPHRECPAIEDDAVVFSVRPTQDTTDGLPESASWVGLVELSPEASSYFELNCSAGHHNPAISGGAVAWIDERNGDSDLYAYDRTAKTEAAVCTATGTQAHPSLSGDDLVWQDQRNGNWDIYAYDLATKTESAVAVRAADQTRPCVSSQKVVWQDERNGNSDIYAYDLTAKTETNVCVRDGVQQHPSISGATVVWADDRNGTLDIYGRNLSGGSEFIVCKAVGAQSRPCVSGNTVVWLDERDGHFDLYGYDLALANEFPIAHQLAYAVDPVVAGDLVLWEDWQGACAYNLKTDSLMHLAGSADVAGETERLAADGTDVVWAGWGVHGATLTYPLWSTSIEIDEGGGAAAPGTAAQSAAAGGAAGDAARGEVVVPTRWVKSHAVTLTMAATSDQGTIDEMCLSDGGITYGAWEAFATTKPFTLSASDGIKTVAVVFRDTAELLSPVASAVIGIDNARPTTKAYAASVAKGHTATLKYRIADAASPYVPVKVTIKVKTPGGRTVKSTVLRNKAVGKTLAWKFRCTLAKGSFKYFVYATDAAGNRQSRVGSARFVVK